MTTSKRTAILLIEDSLSDARLIKESLRDAPHERFSVLTASTLAKGLHKLERDDVDAILLDLALPDCDGIDTFHAVRKRKPSLPVIVLTMTDDEALGLQMIREGAQDYLPKTVLTQETCTAALTRAIRYAIERKCADEQMEALNDRLHAANKELYALNQELRRGVQERTEELASTNKELRILNEELRHETQARTNAERAAQAHAHYLDVLNRVIRAGNEAATLQAALSAMVSTALELTDLDSGVVFLLNDAQGVTELQYEQGYPAERVELIQRLSLSLPSMARIYRGEPVFMEDHRKEVTPEYMVSGMASAIGIPLIAGERIIGHYGAISVRQRHFTTEEREMLITLGREAGTVIARLLAEEATMEHARRQDILTHIISAGNSTTSLQAASVAMLDTALELLSLDNGGIFLRDGDAMTLQYERGYTAEQRAWSQRIPITQPRIARIMEGTPWISDDYQADVTPEVRAMNRDVASMATVPLTAGDAAVGFYQLVSVRRPHHFTDEERGLLVAIGKEAGTVIARLQTQEALAHELAITETITRLTPPLLSPSLDFDALVLAILDDAKRLTGSVHGFIALIDPVTKDLISHGHTQMLLGECAIPAEERQIRFPVGSDGKYHALSTYAINERKGFFTNAPAEHPAATGTPDGHVPLERFLAVPAFVGNEVVGEIALANPKRDYTERDVVVAGRLAEELLALAVQRLRTEAEIQHYAEHLEDLVEERTAQLAKSEQQYRTLVETANSIIIAMKTDQTITFINDYGAHFFGYTPEELIGKDVITLVPEVESTGRPLAPHVRDILARPDEYATNLNENITKDGRRVWVQWVNRGLVDHEGRHIGHLAIGIDVTAFKQTEAALKNAERLAGIGQTAAMIGHDLRNPLQGLQYIVDLQKLRFDKVPPDKRSTEDWEKEQALFDRISEQVFYMDKIVGDLQDYARPIELEHEEITIRTVIDDVLESLPPSDAIETVINVSDQTFVADPHLMLRVFSNLVLNAVQAMPKGGTLTIGAEAIDGSVAIHVSDTGVGIPAEMRDKLFSPLTTGKAKGTGLGLAVVKRIVEAHNGTITFESEEGRGTTFIITLPQTAA